MSPLDFYVIHREIIEAQNLEKFYECRVYTKITSEEFEEKLHGDTTIIESWTDWFSYEFEEMDNYRFETIEDNGVDCKFSEHLPSFHYITDDFDILNIRYYTDISMCFEYCNADSRCDAFYIVFELTSTSTTICYFIIAEDWNHSSVQACPRFKKTGHSNAGGLEPFGQSLKDLLENTLTHAYKTCYGPADVISSKYEPYISTAWKIDESHSFDCSANTSLTNRFVMKNLATGEQLCFPLTQTMIDKLEFNKSPDKYEMKISVCDINECLTNPCGDAGQCENTG